MDLKMKNSYLAYSERLVNIKMNKLNFRKILQLGVKEEATFKEILRTELCNQFIFIGLSIICLHIIFNLFVFQSIPDPFTTLSWFSLLFIGLILVITKHSKAARIFIVYGGVMVTFILYILFGPNLRLESMYLLFIVASGLFFDRKLMFKTTIFIITVALIAFGVCLFIQPPFEAYISPAGPYSRFIFCAIMIVSLIGKLTWENLQYNSIILKQNEELTESYQQLKSFNYIISHDLREPIQTIVGLSQIIEGTQKKGKVIEDNLLQIIVDSGKKLDKQIEDLIEFRDSTDKILRNEVFTIQEIIEELEQNLTESVVDKNVKIICKNFPSIKSSRIALFIILKNLIENSIKYNDKKDPTICVHGQIENGMATIKIKDNGIGIDKESFKDVFTLFKRLDTNFQKGSGLGLSIVKNLMKRLNGEISIIESHLKKGTTFMLKFPVILNE